MTDAPKRLWLGALGWTWREDQINDADTEYVRADLHAEALEAAEQRGYVRGLREAEKACVGEYLEDEASTEDDAAYDRAVADCIMAVRALSPTPPAPVQEAARVLANMVENRKWPCYPIEMPLTRDGRGPATLGVDASTMSYEVWDAVSLRALSDHEKLPDAIESWLRALAEQSEPSTPPRDGVK